MSSAPRPRKNRSLTSIRRNQLLSVLTLEDRSVPAGVTPTAPDHDHEGLNTQPTSYSFAEPAISVDTRVGDVNTIAKNALAAVAPQAGLTPADAAAVTVTDSYTSLGQSHVYFFQQLNGLPVINATAGVHLAENLQPIMVNAAFVPNVAAVAPAAVPPVVDAVQAVERAATEFGYTLTTPPVVLSVDRANRETVVVSESEFSDLDIRVQRAYVNTTRGVRPVWEMAARTPDGDHWYHATVDTQDGAVEYYADWVEAFDAYNVVPTPQESPQDTTGSPRTVLVNPADPVASPLGWHDTDGGAGAEFNDTRGNNVYAQEDADANNTGGVRPSGGANRIFDFPFPTTQAPSTYLPALTTNLFYANNVIHDVTHRYGFDEAAGNFQQNNYGRGGAGGDAVQADAQDGNGTNNANFGTPPDGTAPRMQMYRFTLTNPNRDSDFDNGIIFHEYGHGISNRLTGGPANASALTAIQSRGMGEGWSDFFALMLTQKPGDQANDRQGLGTYVLGQPQTGNGIRSSPYDNTGAPYSFDTSINTMTFAQYGSAQTGTEVHNTGARWASALWDLNWLLIRKYGYDQDLTTGYTAGNTPAGAGNKLAIRLVLDAMKIQAVNPSFIVARDAILQADRTLTGGVNQREIWTAFARRGLGFGAATGSSTSSTLTASFAMPTTPGTTDPAVIAQTPAGVTPAAPGSLTLTFSEAMNQTSFDPTVDVASFTGPFGVIPLTAITGFAWTTTSTLRIDFSLLTPPGAYSLVLGPNITAADNGAQMNQDFDTTSGETPDDQYTANFRYDPLPLTVTAVAPANGTNTPFATTAVDVTFSEAVLTGTLTASDLNLSLGTASAVAMLSTTQARFTVSGFPTTFGEIPVYLSLKYGAATDAAGFASLAFNSSFVLDYDTVAFPTPLTAAAPLGSLVYDGTFPVPTSVGVSSPADADVFTITLDPDQRLSVVVTPAAGTGLIPVVEILDPATTVLTTATGTAGAATTATAAVVGGGTYSVRVRGSAGTTGAYTVRLLLNALGENELYGGPSNDTTGTAQNLGTMFVSPTAGLSVVSVVGRTDATGPRVDLFAVPLASNELVSVGLKRTTGTSATVQLLGPDGTTVIASGAAASAFNQTIDATAGAAGVYYVRINDTTATGYQLTVSRGGVLDRGTSNMSTTAQPLAVNQLALGAVTASDSAWYTVTLAAGQSAQFRTRTPGDTAGNFDNNLDPVLQVYGPDPSTTLVDSNDNDPGGDGRNALVTLASPAAGTYRVRVQATNATSGEYVLSVTQNPNQPPENVSAGGPYTVAEDGTVTLTATATDPNGDALTYAWELNNDNSFDDATGPSVLLTPARRNTLGINDGLLVGMDYPISVRASDANSSTTSPVGKLTVTNAAPTGTLANSGRTTEGRATPTTVTVTAVDPSATDTMVGFTYEFDLDNDGIYETTTGLGVNTATVPSALLADGAKTLIVNARAIDKDGLASAKLTTTITVDGVGPTGTLANGGAVTEGSAGSVSVTGVSDPSSADTAAGFRYEFFFDADATPDFVVAATTTPPTAVTVPASFLADGPMNRLVRVRIFDEDGDFSDATTTITVLSAPPTTSLTGSSGVEGGTFTVTFGSVTDPSPADTLAGFRYRYDFDNNGTFDTAFLTTNRVGVPLQYVQNSGTVTVRAAVFDDDDDFSVYTTTLVIGNVDPTATLAGGTVPEGTDGTVTFSAQVDPSPLDLAGLRYSFDFGNDGSFEVVNATSPTAAVPTQTLDGPATLAVRGRVTDPDGGFTEYTTIVVVANANPTVSATAAPVSEGSVATVTATATDPSAVDQASLRYAFDFNNDGSFEVGGADYSTATPTASATFATTESGPLTVRVLAYDKDGGSVEQVITVPVANANPTGTLGNGGAVVEGGTATVAFTNAADASAADAAALSYSFDFDNDGTFDLVNVTTPTVTVPALYLPDGPAVLTVRGRVTDKDGGFTDYTTAIAVTNAVPTAAFASDGAVAEATTGSVTFSTLFDASPTDRAAGYRYAFDFDNDGTFDLGDGTYAGAVTAATAAVPPGFLTDGPTDRTVRGRILDKDGGFTEGTAVVRVTNTAPTGSLSASPVVVVGQPTQLSFANVIDAAGDAAAGFRFEYDFVEGGTTTTRTGGASIGYTFASPGTYTVRGRVIDKDGGVSEYAATTVVTTVAPTGGLTAAATVEGESSTVAFGPISSPSARANASGFRYSYDFDNDGTFDLGDGTYAGSVTAASAAEPASLLLNSGTYTVRARVVEVDGGAADLLADVVVANAAPRGVLTVPARPVGAEAAFTISLANATDLSPRDAAALRYSFDTNGDGVFDVVNATSPVISLTIMEPGRYTVTGRVTDPDGGFADSTATIGVVEAGTVPPPPIIAPPAVGGFAVGADAGGLTRTVLFGDRGELLFDGAVFPTEFDGGVRVATGDVDGDGVIDLIAGTGPGRTTLVRVISGATRQELFSIQPFESSFTGGVYVAAGDVDGDGRAELAISPDEGGGPRVRVFRGGAFTLLTDYFGIDDPNFRGGARPAFGDVNGDGRADLLVAAGFGGGPRVSVWDGAFLGTRFQRTLFGDFFLFEQSLRNGVYITAGDLDGDGMAEVITGGGPGGGPRVFALNGRSLMSGQFVPAANFFAGDPTSRGGARVSAGDLDGDGRADILAGTGPGAGSRVARYLGSTISGVGQPPLDADDDYFPGLNGGVFVG